MIWDFLLRRKRKKVAVILHGYPSPIQKEMPIWQMLEELGYEVIMPRYLDCKESFGIEWVAAETERLLDGRKPDLIVGISLGGLMLPQIAIKYPNAKVVFAATGTRLKPKMKWFDWTVDFALKKHGIKAAKLLTRVPEKAMAFGYDLVHKPKDATDRVLCEMDKKTIIKVFKSTYPERHIEVARFARNSDTREILGKLKNKALVCMGRQDELMPPEVGEELAGLLQNCRIVKVDAQHFNVLNSQALEEIRKFIIE